MGHNLQIAEEAAEALLEEAADAVEDTSAAISD